MVSRRLTRAQYQSSRARGATDDCMKTDHPENCTHKLAEMPRWLSSAKMEVVKSLLR